jgi:hypothetical protein
VLLAFSAKGGSPSLYRPTIKDCVIIIERMHYYFSPAVGAVVGVHISIGCSVDVFIGCVAFYW